MQNKRLLRFFIFLISLISILICSIPTSSSKAYSFSLEDLQKPNKLNLLILVSASKYSDGRLNNEPGAKTRLEIMRESILSVLEQNLLPPSTNVGIMALGHKFDLTDFAQTCSAANVEIVVPFHRASADIDPTYFMNIQGMGESPITLALEEAGKMLPNPSPDTLSVILLIADGIDTCHSTPAIQARILSENQQIVIYTISFLAGANELEAIAQSASGKNFNIPGWLNTNERASEELIQTLRSAFVEILAQVSTPVLPSDSIITSTFVNTSTPNPANTLTPTNTLTLTNIPIQPTPETVPPVPTSTEKPPSLPAGTFGIVVIVTIAILGSLAFRFRRLRATPTIKTQTTESGSKVNLEDKVENFRRDLDNAYAATGTRKYIPLELLKQKLAGKYALEQFDELLIRARRKYPNKIWIDKDANGRTIMKIIH
jgi:hypothetical protein